MQLIVGLGNPGKEYQQTRHNFGFMLLDYLADQHHFSFQSHKKSKSEMCETQWQNQKIIFVKPQTFMNLSGESVQYFSGFYQIPATNILVIYDDLDLNLGILRLAKQGSSGGHNGIKSIHQHLGHSNFGRLKLGIGRPNPPQKPVNTHVLEPFNKQELPHVKDVLKNASECLELFLNEGFDVAMNRFNKTNKPLSIT